MVENWYATALIYMYVFFWLGKVAVLLSTLHYAAGAMHKITGAYRGVWFYCCAFTLVVTAVTFIRWPYSLYKERGSFFSAESKFSTMRQVVQGYKDGIEG